MLTSNDSSWKIGELSPYTPIQKREVSLPDHVSEASQFVRGQVSRLYLKTGKPVFLQIDYQSELGLRVNFNREASHGALVWHRVTDIPEEALGREIQAAKKFLEESQRIFEKANAARLDKEHPKEHPLQEKSKNFLSSFSEGVSLLTDGNSLLRNGLVGLAVVTSGCLFVLLSLLISSAAWVYTGERVSGEYFQKLKEEYKVKDREGVSLSGLNMGTGLGLVGMGIATFLEITGKVVAKFGGSSGLNVGAAGTASLWAGFITFGCLAVASFYETAMNLVFAKKVQHISDDGKVVEIMKRMASEVKGGDAAALEKKWNRFARRTDQVVCEKARMLLDEAFLRELESELQTRVLPADQIAMRMARQFLMDAKIANGRKLIVSSIFLIISILGLGTSIVGMYVSSPWIPALFWALGAIFWFFVDSSKLQGWIGDKFCPNIRLARLPSEEEREELKKKYAPITPHNLYQEFLKSLRYPTIRDGRALEPLCSLAKRFRGVRSFLKGFRTTVHERLTKGVQAKSR